MPGLGHGLALGAGAGGEMARGIAAVRPGAVGVGDVQVRVPEPDGQRKGIQEGPELIVGGEISAGGRNVAHPQKVGHGPAVLRPGADAEGVDEAALQGEQQIEAGAVTAQVLDALLKRAGGVAVEAGEEVAEARVRALG